ncbi:hypothetical protein [Spirosoma pollinicola]|uniref:Lipocalin-like domain-containing protein n=1 Tax=Spirosoma pollinicola TaxID=2057025 RepID=A0A2K8YZE7_9BACT|nr:hypothetical protein [Spirosoma pollinicola]AUD03002.1 hypothetical protein CWM47_14870 [Spirosoma pollinicola]
MKKVFYLSLTLFLASLLVNCKDTTAAFSPGAGDARITGTWRLVERLYPINVDYYVQDSFYVAEHYKKDSLFQNGLFVGIKDSVLVPGQYQKTSIKVTKSVDTTRQYAANPAQTLTFGTDGQLTSEGAEMTYYLPTKYYRVDTTYPDSLFLNLYISTNRTTVAFAQGVKIEAQTLTILPRCERACYSKFVRVP